MSRIQPPKIFAGLAGIIVFATLVNMGLSLGKTRDQSSSTSTASTVAAVVTIGGADGTSGISGTVPIATSDTTLPSPTTTLLGEILPAPTTTTTPPPVTLAPGVPTSMFLVGGNSAQLLGQTFASRVWPMRVRMITGDPIANAIRLLVPTAESRVVVYDPAMPTDAATYASTISTILAAAAPATVVWVEDWRPERGPWRDAIAAAAKASKTMTVLPTATLVAKSKWLDPAGGLVEDGRDAVIDRVVAAVNKPR